MIAGADEIVGALINGWITNSLPIIRGGIEVGKPYKLISRAEMNLMAACDLGKCWEEMASWPTLFYMIDGNPSWIKAEK